VTGTNNDRQTNEAKKGSADKPASSTAAASDSVRLSAAGVDLAKLEQSVAQSDGVDRSKVEAIKTALQRGDYPFDADKVAEKMLSMESFLGV
jgi:negative regulator of flagellin synthesis FlgM